MTSNFAVKALLVPRNSWHMLLLSLLLLASFTGCIEAPASPDNPTIGDIQDMATSTSDMTDMAKDLGIQKHDDSTTEDQPVDAVGEIIYEGERAVEVGRSFSFKAYWTTDTNDPEKTTPLQEITLEKIECDTPSTQECIKLDPATNTISANSPGEAELVLRYNTLKTSVAIVAENFTPTGASLLASSYSARQGDEVEIQFYIDGQRGWRRPAGEFKECTSKNTLGGLLLTITNGFFTASTDSEIGAQSWTISCTLANGATYEKDAYLFIHPKHEIKTNQAHSCVINSSGDLQCWGDNIKGQLGTGLFRQESIPKTIAPALKPSHFDVGPLNTCLVDQDGNLYAWGTYNQLTRANGQSSPQMLSPLGEPDTKFIECVVGTRGVCGLSDQGELWCTHSADTVFGDERADNLIRRDDKRFFTLSAGETHACGITRVGNVLCWGEQFHNNEPPTDEPTQVSGPGKSLPNGAWISLDVGDTHACGVIKKDVDTALHCWGENNTSQLGTSNVSDKFTQFDKTQIDNKSPLHVTAGGSHTCLTTRDKTLYCWGREFHGALGIIVTTPPPEKSNEINAVTRLSQITQIPLPKDFAPTTSAAGLHHTCAITDRYEARCWGNNSKGRLGDANISEFTPNFKDPSINFSNLSWTPIDQGYQPVSLDLGFQSSCAKLEHPSDISKRDKILCWGRNDNTRGTKPVLANNNLQLEPTVLQSPNSVQAPFIHGLALSYFGACITYPRDGNPSNIVTDCWGSGFAGQNQFEGPRPEPQRTKLKTDQEIQAGKNHMCVLDQARTGVLCWGSNKESELGRPREKNCNNNNLLCDDDPQLVQFASPAPKTPFDGLSVGDSVGCVWHKEEAKAYCWGYALSFVPNFPYILEEATQFDLQQNEAKDLLQVAVGRRHACAILADKGQTKGSLYCFGDNTLGQLGDPSVDVRTSTYKPDELKPVLQNVSRVETFSFHTCAIQRDDTIDTESLWCWGRNVTSQVGVSLLNEFEEKTPQVITKPVLIKTFNRGDRILDLATHEKHTCLVLDPANNDPNGIYCWGDNSLGQTRWRPDVGLILYWNSLPEAGKGTVLRF